MALKFLNKKGWHTGSLRNIENVWKAEQKNDAEQKKLEELKKQIHEERERAEFRHLQEQAGLVPRQERLEFLYDSGLAVGKSSSSSGFKELESYPKPPDAQAAVASSSSAQQQAAPGALFAEEKPQSANDSWRKLHSDPLLLIRKREQEALARVKNNPVQMAMIRKSVEAGKDKKDTQNGKEHKSKHHHKKSKHRKHSSSRHHSDSDHANSDEDERKPKGGKGLNHEESSYRRARSPDDQLNEEEDMHRKKSTYRDSKHKEVHPNASYDARTNRKEDSYNNRKEDSYNGRKEDSYSSRKEDSYNNRKEDSYNNRKEELYNSRKEDSYNSRKEDSYNNRKEDSYNSKRDHETSHRGDYCTKRPIESDHGKKDRGVENIAQRDRLDSSDTAARRESSNKRRNPVKVTEEERAARLREMQMDAELHEEQRWKRLKKAEEKDAQEAIQAQVSGGRNFLDAAQKSIYGAEKGGSATIEESVRRRKYYSQNRSGASESNAFRR